MTSHTESSPEQRQQMLSDLLTVRLAEQQIQDLFLQNLVRGTTHLCIGQEACSVGVASAMQPGDTLTCTYRGHGYALAMGMSLNALMAEMMGKASGACGGKGGSMHMTAADLGLLGANAIVGAQIPIAVGAGLSAKVKKENRISIAIMGDGATNIGAFHESLNMASIWKLPVLFIVENNLYGEYSPIATTTPVENIADRAAAYGMPGIIVDGQDAEAVRAAVMDAASRARSGEGPSLIELKTYRFSGHSRTDKGLYRPEGELESWLKRDPIDILKARMIEAGQIDETEYEELYTATERSVYAAVEWAKAEAFPSLEAASQNIYYGR